MLFLPSLTMAGYSNLPTGRRGVKSVAEAGLQQNYSTFKSIWPIIPKNSSPIDYQQTSLPIFPRHDRLNFFTKSGQETLGTRMHRRASWALSTPLSLRLQAGEEGADVDRLRGEWALVETADTHCVDPGADSIRMVITTKTITMLFGRLETNRGTMVIGQSKG